MIRTVCVSLVFMAFFNCSNNPETFVEHIEGYWEIDEVTLKDGSKRDYNFNSTIDYIEITDSLTGFRKKLKPNFSGTFETSNDAEQLKIVLENDSLNLYYKTLFHSWKETVLNATKDELLILNANKDMYLYKRYEPINLEE